MKHHIQILKFGGTSVGNGTRIRHVAQIVTDTFDDADEAFPVVVVSAMTTVTDQLLRIARYACEGEHGAWKHELTLLQEKHREAARDAIHDPTLRTALCQELEMAFATLACDVSTVHTLSYPAKGGKVAEAVDTAAIALAVAAVAAWGERFSVLLLAAAINDLGLRAEAVRQEVIVTEVPEWAILYAPGTVIGADPLPEETRKQARKLISPVIERDIVPVVPGFIGRTADGHVTTLGRNGSDYSATVIGVALNCIEVSIYTDVDGILTTDPRIVMNARLLPRLSYYEAARLSWFGAKVLHPRTLIPIAPCNIPVHVRNTFSPHLRGTVVGPEGTQRSGATAITVRRHLAQVTVESTDLFGVNENAGEVFALAARVGATPIVICASSGHSLAFMVEEQVVESVIALLQHDKGAWNVYVRDGLAVCACIGSGFSVDPLSPAKAISSLAREHIPLVTQGASELGITLIIADEDSERALRCLHRDLIAPVIPLLRHGERASGPLQHAQKASEI